MFTGEKRDVYHDIAVVRSKNLLHFLGPGNQYHSLSLRQPRSEGLISRTTEVGAWMVSKGRKIYLSKIETTYQNLKCFSAFPQGVMTLFYLENIQVTRIRYATNDACHTCSLLRFRVNCHDAIIPCTDIVSAELG